MLFLFDKLYTKCAKQHIFRQSKFFIKIKKAVLVNGDSKL